jgi:hypothetical protein
MLHRGKVDVARRLPPREADIQPGKATVDGLVDGRGRIDRLEALEAGATEDELSAEMAVARITSVRGFTRKRSERNIFPDHLPRERVAIDPPTACECCGGNRLRKLGEDVTRILETQPRRWKAIETVREKSTCLDFGRRGDIDQRGP